SPGYGILPHDFHIFGDYLYFGGDDDVHGDELWRTDGTSAGTKMVADLRPGTYRPNVYQMFDFQGAFYFVYQDATYGYQLFRSDGTSNGTRMVPNPAQAANYQFPRPVVIYRDLIWYVTTGGSNSTAQLWASDGTAAGTKLVTELASGPSELVPLGDSFIFSDRDPAKGLELFKLPLPTARTGGPYQVKALNSIQLDASQSSGTSPGETLTFEWDLDGDGIYGEIG